MAAKPPSVDKEMCIGCCGCVAVCPNGVLESGPDHKTMVAHPEKCTGCGECLTVCPVMAITRDG